MDLVAKEQWVIAISSESSLCVRSEVPQIETENRQTEYYKPTRMVTFLPALETLEDTSVKETGHYLAYETITRMDTETSAIHRPRDDGWVCLFQDSMQLDRKEGVTRGALLLLRHGVGALQQVEGRTIYELVFCLPTW